MPRKPARLRTEVGFALVSLTTKTTRGPTADGTTATRAHGDSGFVADTC